MRFRTHVVVAAALVVAGSAGATASTAGPGLVLPKAGLTATLSSTRAGARNVTLVLKLAYLMQCSQPGPEPIVIALPKGMGAPGTVRPDSVLLDGKPTPAKLADGSVTVATPALPPVMCDVIAIGTATVTFTPRAGLRNPLHAGRYTIAAKHGNLAFSTTVTIR